MKDINKIKSKYFTQDIPARAKFKLGEHCVVRPCFVPAKTVERNKRWFRDNGCMIGTIIGMQRQTDPKFDKTSYDKYARPHRINRYYVLFSSGDIHPISSMYVN